MRGHVIAIERARDERSLRSNQGVVARHDVESSGVKAELTVRVTMVVVPKRN